jgi:hypothetical protein
MKKNSKHASLAWLRKMVLALAVITAPARKECNKFDLTAAQYF